MLINKNKLIFVLLLCVAIGNVTAGPLSGAICSAGCAVLVCSCYAAGGLTFGTVTAGIANLLVNSLFLLVFDCFILVKRRGSTSGSNRLQCGVWQMYGGVRGRHHGTCALKIESKS